jgi:hypothetical protein
MAQPLADLTAVWTALHEWDLERPRTFQLDGCRAQLYRGAMEIPLVAFRPREPVRPTADQLAALNPVLDDMGLELDCVEVDRNYKINRKDTKEYVGRIMPDALKLHAERILDLGREAFEQIVTFYLGSRPPPGT